MDILSLGRNAYIVKKSYLIDFGGGSLEDKIYKDLNLLYSLFRLSPFNNISNELPNI